MCGICFVAEFFFFFIFCVCKMCNETLRDRLCQKERWKLKLLFCTYSIFNVLQMSLECKRAFTTQSERKRNRANEMNKEKKTKKKRKQKKMLLFILWNAENAINSIETDWWNEKMTNFHGLCIFFYIFVKTKNNKNNFSTDVFFHHDRLMFVLFLRWCVRQ